MEEVLPSLSESEQYKLVFKAGEILRTMHQVFPDIELAPWEEGFNRKLDMNIERYKC
ncbi:hypothetical protein [Alkaliphilus pronyensis]|uniref:hypothetical protein n=1 Tax=Alkaliphilus pronyensis TaxID=1482732 RepID=UPI00186575A1|nr:hypothetical protein [Alkaliphilus pronyensis]